MSDIFKIQINDAPYTNFTASYENFTKVEIYKSLEKASGEFYFEASNTLGQSLPFGKGDKSTIYIGDKKVMTGYINSVGGSYDATSHSLRIRGREKTQDLIDSSLRKGIDFKKSIHIVDVIKKVMSLNNITGIKVIVPDGITIKPFSGKELISAERGKNIFEQIERFCRLRQVLLNTNADGDLVLQRAGSNKYSVILKCVGGRDSIENNILRADFEDNDANRFYEYIVMTQGSVVSEVIDNQREKVVAVVKDSNVRTSRILVINSQISSDVQTSKDRAKWESNIRRTKGFQYNCRIRGYHLDAEQKILIEPNYIINVQDEKLGIQGDLLIKTCKYSKGTDGSFTDLELVNLDAFTLEVEKKALDAKFNKFDQIFKQVGL